MTVKFWISQFVFALSISHFGNMVSAGVNCSTDYLPEIMNDDMCYMSFKYNPTNFTETTISVDWNSDFFNCVEPWLNLCMDPERGTAKSCIEVHNVTEGTLFFNGLTPGTKHTFRLAMNSVYAGCALSDYSDFYTLPSAPQNVQVVPWYTPQTTLTVTWDQLGSYHRRSISVLDDTGHTCVGTKTPFGVQEQISPFVSYFSGCVPDTVYYIIVSVSLYGYQDELHIARSDLVTYKTPLFSLDVNPLYGPISGGTDVRLIFPDGALLEPITRVWFLDNQQCYISYSNLSMVMCTTSAGSEELIGVPQNIKTSSENGQMDWNATYTYIDDPNIISIHPLKTITAGGIAITVNGTDLNIIQQTIMEITMTVRSWISSGPDVEYHENSTLFSSECETPSFYQVVCISEPMDINSTLLIPEDCCQQSPPSTPCECVTFYLGFLMDNVEEFRNLTANEELNQYGLITVAAPPVFVEDQMLKYDKDLQLDIRGEGFLGTPLEEYSVFLGADGHTCPVTYLFDNLLTCTPPDKTRQTFSSVHVRVQVSVGTNLWYNIGRLTYVSRIDVAVYVVVPVVIIAAIITAAVFITKRQNRKALKDQLNRSHSDRDSVKSDNIEFPRVSELSDHFDQQEWDKVMGNRGSGLSIQLTDNRNNNTNGNCSFDNHMDLSDDYLAVTGDVSTSPDYVNQRVHNRAIDEMLDRDVSSTMKTKSNNANMQFEDSYLSLEPDYPTSDSEDCGESDDGVNRFQNKNLSGANRVVHSVYQGFSDTIGECELDS